MANALPIAAANDPQPISERRGERHSVLLAVTIQSGANCFPARLRNVSRDGAKVEAGVIPPQGSFVCFSRGAISVTARVVWTNRSCFGLEFRDAIDEDELLVVVGRRKPKLAEQRKKALFPLDDYIPGPLQSKH